MHPEQIDWAQSWRDAQAQRRKPDNSEFWNNRAPSFLKVAGTSPYAMEFVKRAQLQPGETVFDMGCGSGTLALPLARQGHKVWGCDFSPVMLELMERQAQAEGIQDLIIAQEMSWEDEWTSFDLPKCDVAFASRSIATSDLEAALLKLEGQARRRVCITLSGGLSPRIDDVLFKAIGRKMPAYREYMYAMNILWQLGRRPELSLIVSERDTIYASPEEALEKNVMVMEASKEEAAVLERYVSEHLNPLPNDPEGRWSFDHTRRIEWGFISWEPVA